MPSRVRHGGITGSRLVGKTVILAAPDGGFEPAVLPINSPGGAAGQSVTATAIASAEAFGTTKASFTLFPSAIATAEAFGTPLVVLRLIASGIASAEAFGTPAAHLRLFPAGVASAEAFGTATLVTAQTITFTGIASGEAFGNPVLSLRVALGAIASSEAFGQTQLNLRVTAVGIGTAEALGQPSVALRIVAGGIGSTEAIGAVTIVGGGSEAEQPPELIFIGGRRPKVTEPPEVRPRNAVIAMPAIPTMEAFGRPGVVVAFRSRTRRIRDEEWLLRLAA